MTAPNILLACLQPWFFATSFRVETGEDDTLQMHVYRIASVRMDLDIDVTASISFYRGHFSRTFITIFCTGEGQWVIQLETSIIQVSYILIYFWL